MIYDVSHKTIFRYSAPVAQSQHLVHMTPRTVDRQTVKGHTLLVDPAPTVRTEREDYYGNRVVMFDIEQEHRELTVHA
jgi:transglutaminase-like putative cysteine protease